MSADGVLCYALQTPLQVPQSVGLLLHRGNEPFGSRGRGLDTGVHNHIHDTDVACMTNTRNDGQREISTVERQTIVVEVPQVGSCAAAANNHHYVVRIHRCRYLLQCCYERGGRLFALHKGREELCAEAKTATIALQLMTEVAIARGIRRRDDCHATRQQGHLHHPLQVHHTIFLQALDSELALSSQIA